MEEKKWPLLLGSIGLVVTLVTGASLFTLYNKNKDLERKLNSVLYPSILNSKSNDTSLLEKVDSLEKQFTTTTDNIRQIIFQNSHVQDLIESPQFVETWENSVVSHYKKQNSLEVSGGLRIMATKKDIFSFDIPEILYKNGSVEYRMPFKNIYGEVDSIGHWYFSNDADNFYTINFPDTMGMGENIVSCSKEYSKDVQAAATGFKFYFQKLVDFNVDLESVDWCKYTIAQKQLPEALRATAGQKDILSPTIAKPDDISSHIWKGYIFDSEKFYKEKVLTKEFLDNPAYALDAAPRLFIALSYSNSPGVPAPGIPNYRFIEVVKNAGRGDGFYKEPKAEQDRVNNILNQTIQSIANTAVLLPECVYFCAY